MYFFFNPTTRKIISATEMGLTESELEQLRPPGAELIQESPENLEDWKYELSDYYISDDNKILKASEYNEFAEVLSLPIDDVFEWVVVDENTQIYDIARGNLYTPSMGETIYFQSVDPGIYKYELSSKCYKTCLIVMEVKL